MRDFLVKSALSSVWCAPFQDAQATLELSRATGHGGIREKTWLQQTLLFLPTANHNYHVYQIGQNSPIRFDLEIKKSTWYRLSDVCTAFNKMIALYSDRGVLLCRRESFIMLTEALTFVIAVRLQPTVVNLNKTKLYLKLYSNAYFDSIRSSGVMTRIDYRGGFAERESDVLVWQQAYRNYDNATQGKALAYVNGRLVNDFPPGSYRIGDLVEWFFDASIYDRVDYSIATLPTFESELDQKQKYLVHSPKGLNFIDYQDDLLIFVVHKKPNGVLDGVLLLRHQVDSIRQLTHRDYSVPVQLVQATVANNPNWLLDGEISLRVYYRYGGFQRPLVDEHTRIKELYRLSDTEIIRAMVGLDSTISEWKASQLEQSNYPRIMSSLFGNITAAETCRMYGYNALARLVGDTPQRPLNGEVRLPVGLRAASTVFEYDAQGLLVDIAHHINDGEVYFCKQPQTTLVEVVEGLGVSDIEIQDGFVTAPYDPLQTQKVYACKIVDGLRDNVWFEVTSNPDYVRVVGNQLTWVGDSTRYARILKGNTHFTLIYRNFTDAEAIFKFDVFSDTPATPLRLAPAKVDVWLNGLSLIENIDFYVQWPSICICNKEWLVAGTQEVKVRAMGFADGSNARKLTQQIGFVKHGELSLNNYYDTRDDKVIRCIVNGRYLERSAVAFAENNHNVSTDPALEGKPFSIDGALVAIRGAVDYNTYPYLSESLVMDEKVGDYLNLRLPEHTHDELTAIVERYTLYSPAMHKLIQDLMAGNVIAPALTATVDEKQALAEQYIDVLQFDPIRRGFDQNFVVVHPHRWNYWIDLPAEQYRFCEWFNRYYLNNRLDFTPFIGIAV